jgi:hypothetical protein
MRAKTFLGCPKQFGWKPPSKAKPSEKAKAARSYGWRVSGASRQRMVDEELPRRAREGKYLLAPCLVLWAAVWGTRAAYCSAMEVLPWARSHDFQGV